MANMHPNQPYPLQLFAKMTMVFYVMQGKADKAAVLNPISIAENVKVRMCIVISMVNNI